MSVIVFKGVSMLLEPWLIWLIIGIICVIIEIFDPAVFFISLGIGGLVTSPIAALGTPIWLQVLIFGLVSFVVFLLMRKVYERLIKKNRVETNVYALVGKQGLVLSPITQDVRGQVKVGGENWSAVLEDNSQANIGDKIQVLSIEGNKLIVKKI